MLFYYSCKPKCERSRNIVRANFNLTQLTSVFAVEPLVGPSFECVKLWLILLMANILQQLIGSLSVYSIIYKVLYISGWLSMEFLPSTACLLTHEAGIRGWRAFLKTKILPAIRKKLELSKHDHGPLIRFEEGSEPTWKPYTPVNKKSNGKMDLDGRCISYWTVSLPEGNTFLWCSAWNTQVDTRR